MMVIVLPLKHWAHEQAGCIPIKQKHKTNINRQSTQSVISRFPILRQIYSGCIRIWKDIHLAGKQKVWTCAFYNLLTHLVDSACVLVPDQSLFADLKASHSSTHLLADDHRVEC